MSTTVKHQPVTIPHDVAERILTWFDETDNPITERDPESVGLWADLKIAKDCLEALTNPDGETADYYRMSGLWDIWQEEIGTTP